MHVKLIFSKYKSYKLVIYPRFSANDLFNFSILKILY